MPSVARTRKTPRLVIFCSVLLLWAGAVVVRLFMLQVVDYAWLLHKAERQQSRVIDLEAARGIIYDRNLHPLAMSLAVDSVFAVPSEMADVGDAARQLAPALALDAADLTGRLHAARNFCWVARKVTPEQAQRVRSLDLRGVYFEKESRRFYPRRDLAAHVLGYVGMDGAGLGGIEQEFDRDIRGRDGRVLVQLDAHRRGYNHLERQPEAGANLVLTIDQNMQYIAQQELEAARRATHAVRGTVAIEDPATGEIFALANSPSFDPNDRHISTDRLEDHAVSDVYEPGSTFKLVTLSAALDQGLTRPDEWIDCQMGSIFVGGRRIHDHHPYGVLTVSEILQHSSDVGAIKLGLRLGEERFYKYIQAFGFGRATGIELPGESRGLARPPQRWTRMSIGALSMGQEVAATPMQIIALGASLANGGVYRRPHLVLGKFSGEKPSRLAALPDGGQRVVAGETANQMKLMLEQVVLHGTGTRAMLDGYTAGGKTGTAQKVDAGTHGYSARHYVASFVGFAPLSNPAIVILVVLDSPVGPHEGGEVAAPVFKKIAERILPYMRIPRDVAPDADLLASHRGRGRKASPDARETSEELAAGDDLASAEATMQSSPEAQRANCCQASTEISDRAAPARRAPNAPDASRPERDTSHDGTVVLTYDRRLAMPDFSGQTLRAVSRACAQLGLDPQLVGSGVARSQQPAPGVAIAAGARIVVRFER